MLCRLFLQFFYLILKNLWVSVRKFSFSCYIWHLWRRVFNWSIYALLPPIVLDNLFGMDKKMLFVLIIVNVFWKQQTRILEIKANLKMLIVNIIFLLFLSIFHLTYLYYRCGNKFDQKSRIAISDSDMEAFCEQCHNLVSGIYKTSCRTGEGVEEMFSDIAKQLTQVNR